MLNGVEMRTARLSRIEQSLPARRGNVSLSNFDIVKTMLNVAEIGCKWRALLRRRGNLHTICACINGWATAGLPDRLFEEPQHQQLIRLKIEQYASTVPSLTCIPMATVR